MSDPINNHNHNNSDNNNNHNNNNNNNNKEEQDDWLYGTKKRLTVEQVQGSHVTYSHYIETDKLLTLQDSSLKGGLHHHDEHLFIVVHQSFELWFKQILHELNSVNDILNRLMNKSGNDEKSYDKDFILECMQVCCDRVKRADSIMRYSLGTFDILESMHPADFLEFRDYIGPASGFQSVQMRQMEVVLGLKDSQRVTCSYQHYTDPLSHDTRGMDLIRQQVSKPSIKHVVYQWLDQCIADRVPSQFMDVFMEKKLDNLRFQKALWHLSTDQMDVAVRKEMQQVEPFLNGEGHDEDHVPSASSSSASSSSGGCPFASSSSTNSDDGDDAEKNGDDDDNNKECPASKRRKLSQDHGDGENTEPDEAVQEHVRRRRLAIMFIMCYRQQPEISTYANLLDDLVAFEEAFLLWRTRHVRMVERMIGRRTGTGGSSGVDYLEGTIKYRVFLDLWQAKSLFIRTTALPRMTLDPFPE